MRKNNPVIENILGSYIDPANIIQKGRGASLGEIRVWKGEKWMKTERPVNNGWVLMTKLDSSEIARLTGGKATPAPVTEGAAPVSKIPEPIEIDVNKRFGVFARYTKAIIQGVAKSMIAYGTGGVGKTWTVQNQMKIAGKIGFDEEIHKPSRYAALPDPDADPDAEINLKPRSTEYDYVKITGKSTPPQVYKALCEHNGKIIIFDDCDSVLTNGDAISLFKGALDTTGDGSIAYGTSSGIKDDEGGTLPKRFKFTGQCIFISNLPSNVVPQPLKSRSLRIDLSMTPEQTIERIRFIAQNKDGEYTNLDFGGGIFYTSDDMKGIIDYLDDHKHDTTDLNVRTIGSILAIKKIADQDGADWREDADQMIFSKGEDAEAIEDTPEEKEELKKGLISKAEAMEILGLSIYDDFLEKGKKASIGEIREWKGVKQQKQPDGSWKPVSDKKSTTDSGKEIKESKGNKPDSEFTMDELQQKLKQAEGWGDKARIRFLKKTIASLENKTEKGFEKLKVGDKAEDVEGVKGVITKISSNIEDFKGMINYEEHKENISDLKGARFVALKTKEYGIAVFVDDEEFINKA